MSSVPSTPRTMGRPSGVTTCQCTVYPTNHGTTVWRHNMSMYCLPHEPWDDRLASQHVNVLSTPRTMGRPSGVTTCQCTVCCVSSVPSTPRTMGRPSGVTTCQCTVCCVSSVPSTPRTMGRPSGVTTCQCTVCFHLSKINTSMRRLSLKGGYLFLYHDTLIYNRLSSRTEFVGNPPTVMRLCVMVTCPNLIRICVCLFIGCHRLDGLTPLNSH